jgi:hypothetical protein
LNFKGLGGSFIVLADEGRICCNLAGWRYYKIENLVFLPLLPFDRDDDRLLNKLDNFQRLVCNFGYYCIGRSATTLLIDKSRFS